MTTFTKDFMQEALEFQVRARTIKVVEEEIAAATRRIREHLMAEIDNMALAILREYDVQRMGERITITVRKPAQP